MLSSHKNCAELLERILPNSLKRKTPNQRVGLQRLYTQQSWYAFFTKEFAQPLNSARELWNDEMRKELTYKLACEIKSFFAAKKSVFVELAKKSQRNSLSHRKSSSNMSGGVNQESQEFGGSSAQQHLVQPLKWNYTEFEVCYDCLAQDYFVGGYYLTKLLEIEADSPVFKDGERIDNPDQFWDQL